MYIGLRELTVCILVLEYFCDLQKFKIKRMDELLAQARQGA